MSFDKDALLRSQNPFDPKANVKGSISGDPGKIFRTGRTAAKKLQAKQSLLIEKQRQKEELSLAEETSEIERRKVLSTSGKAGRRSLIKTTESGIKSENLGGTV